MALIICPECGSQISDTAKVCPKCGYVLKPFLKQIETEIYRCKKTLIEWCKNTFRSIKEKKQQRKANRDIKYYKNWITTKKVLRNISVFCVITSTYAGVESAKTGASHIGLFLFWMLPAIFMGVLSLIIQYKLEQDIPEDIANELKFKNIFNTQEEFSNENGGEQSQNKEDVEVKNNDFTKELEQNKKDESIPLLEFARKHGRLFVGNFTNKETGEHFTACQFGEDPNYVMVYFSEETGIMSPREIADAKDKLVVKLANNGKYYLTYKTAPIVEKEKSKTIVENENQSIDELSPAYWEEIAVNDTIKPLGILTAQDFAQLQNDEYVDKVVSIVADGGTKDQTLAKLEILLGKRIKTKQMLEVEESIREFYRRLFAEALSDAKLTTESSEINKIFERFLALEDIRDTLEMLKNNKSELSKTYQNILDLANSVGVSMNQIEREELNKISCRL